MPDDEKLSPADPGDIAGSIAFALLFSGRKRVHDSDQYMAAIVADRIVRHLECESASNLDPTPIDM
jgi:hypothetical protein